MDVNRVGHLVLRRRPGESITIDGGVITIEVIDIKGGQVGLMIQAPLSTRVDRTEVAERRRKEDGRST